MLSQKKHTPTISVVMPVFNAGAFLHQSIQSILNQTYQDFEFIIVDDASTDASAEILAFYAKEFPCIQVVTNETNLGVSRSVKKALDIAQGSYIARMDADDISLPSRFEKQLAHFEKHTKTVALGTQCHTIDENGRKIGEKTFPLKHADIYRYIFQFIPLQQPSLMIARSRLPSDFSFYNDSFTTAEEVELIFKLFQYGEVENLPHKLLKYRIHSQNTSFQDIKKTFLNTLLSRIQAIYTYGYRPSLTGITVSVMQALLIFCLPKPAIMFIYSNMRFIRKGQKAAHRALPSIQLDVAQ